MKSSLRDILSWVWHIIIRWLAGVATGTDLPLCIERTPKMGVKSNDPEMAVGHEPQETASAESESPGIVLKNEHVSDAFSESDAGEVVVADDKMEAENRLEIVEINANIAETDNDKNGAETSVDSLVPGNSDSNVTAENSDVTNADVQDSLSSNIEGDMGNSGNEEENANGSVVSDNASSNTEVNEGERADAMETNDGENGFAHSKNQKDDVNDSDEDNEIDDDDDNSSEANSANELKVTWLLKLSSRETYQKVLSPQYYSLNFRTATPLQVENVRTAIKQLRSLLPWLGFGLRRQKETMWLCLYPEDVIDFQTADDEDHQWYVVSNCREQFKYLESGCLCTFRLTKVYPCIQCQTKVTDVQTNTTSSISEETQASSSAVSATLSLESDALATPVTSSTSCINTSVAKDTREAAGASGIEETNTESGSIKCSATDSTTVISSTSDTSTSDVSKNTSAIQEASLTADISSNSENESTTSPSITPPNSVHSIKDSKDTTTFTHHYRLVFGIPQPLADETSADDICDIFIKELSNVISRTTCVNADAEKINSSDTAEVNSEIIESNENVETRSEDNDKENKIEQPDDTAIVPDSDVNDTSVPDDDSKQVKSEAGNQQTTDNSETQEKENQIKASIQKQLTILENVFSSLNEDDDKKDKDSVQNNNVDAIDKNSPHVERSLEICNTHNFLNKCKTERVTFVSLFAACVNAALANTLVKQGIKEENQEFKIGHIISLYYNLEDLSDQEWHDHDDDDNSDDEDDDVRRRTACCKAATASLNIKSNNWSDGFWERVHLVDQKRWNMSSDSSGASSQVIPLNTELEINDQRFPSIYQPSANLSISNISCDIPKFSRQLENVEALTLQRLSPLIIFLMTHSISLTLQKNCLRFSFYHQGNFIPNVMAQHFADEIVSVMKQALVS